MADETLGERRVRRSFNPSANSDVEALKIMAASFIDLCDEMRADQTGATSETARLWALAQTAAEEAAMWAVKAATAGT